ncbi:MAG: sigma-70 family RNA polymerase sigma factor [Nocardioidaceae bacterium]
MSYIEGATARGIDALRCAVLEVLAAEPWLAVSGSTTGTAPGSSSGSPPQDYPPGADSDSDADSAATRVAALVDLAKAGDAEAFGALYDHYCAFVYRFVYYRVDGRQQAEDLVSETFFRALRSLSTFTWQGKDFGAWLITIARNLVVDHYKSARQRLESTTDDLSSHAGMTSGPENDVLTAMTNDVLHSALSELPAEQRECVVLRFLSGSSIAETAKALGRSEGAVKQLQHRAIRNLAKLMPEGIP